MIGEPKKIAARLCVAVVLVGRTMAGALAAETEGTIPKDDQCAVCHADMAEAAVDVADYFQVDVHGRASLSCADCHGGDPTSDDPDVAMSKEAGFRGAPDELAQPAFCARCHSDAAYMRRFDPGLPIDQLTLYRTSRHGQRNAAGDRKVATCVSCHGVHDIRPAVEPKSTVHPTRVAETCGVCHTNKTLMAAYNLPADQVDSYKTSVHWQMISEGNDLSAPTCNDCHGNHGALPPEVENIASVCGHCHVKNRDFFRRSPKQKIFDEADLPECETCHGNHAVQHTTDELLGLQKGAICADCHDDDGSRPSTAILLMRAELDSLRRAVDESHDRLDAAIQKGMYVADSEFKWRDARQTLLEARTAVHLFSPDALRESTAEGLRLASEVDAEAEHAIAQYGFRRKGLLISTLIITVLAISLYLKIRQIEGR